MTEAKHTPELALPWTSVANSWQYTTIYDSDGVPMCSFDLEDWGVDEDNQDALEARQTALVETVVRAVNSYDSHLSTIAEMKKALEAAASSAGFQYMLAETRDQIDAAIALSETQS